MAVSGAGPGALQPFVRPIKALADLATTASFDIYALDFFNVRVSDVTISGPSSAVVTNNDNGTYTIGRPANGLGDASMSAVFRKDGYASVRLDFTVPQQDALPGALIAVSMTETSTQATFAYTFTGTLTYYKNGVLVGDPGPSPLILTKPTGSTKDTYKFHCVGQNGTIDERTIDVQPQPVASGGPTPGTATPSGYGFATMAEFNDHCALVEKLRLIAVAEGKMS